ncbi:hypothetical protein [Nonomuraea sp. NPDC005501]|uniref:hypothetical protein n=1 Tax=Nonomuraea sp. NPDC005501 TaxID=3156884 RepID=UPI0033BE4397
MSLVGQRGPPYKDTRSSLSWSISSVRNTSLRHIFCVDEFGPLNLQPRPGKQWTDVGGKYKDPERGPRQRMRATYTRTQGLRHLFAALDLGKDKMYGHVKKRRRRGEFLEFCRYPRSLYPPEIRIAII